jgi:ABC-2 type transport system ATP-binding protein
MGANHSIAFSGVSKHFGGRVILDRVAGTVGTGITAVLGPNGAGKTTLLRILAGLLPSDEGRFHLDNTLMSPESRIWRNQIGYLPQTPGLYERMTVRDYLDYMLLLSGWNERDARTVRIAQVIEQLNLVTYTGTPIGHLSGGTKQRAAIAQALIHHPMVLLLDEPTNNLDADERERFHRLLADIGRERIVVVIAHIVDEIAAYSTKLMVVSGSRITFLDTPAALLALAGGALREDEVEKAYRLLLHSEMANGVAPSPGALK